MTKENIEKQKQPNLLDKFIVYSIVYVILKTIIHLLSIILN